MALDLSQNFVSAQYLENKLTEFHHILYMQSYWQDLACDYYTSFFAHLHQSYGPWLTPKFCFCSMSWEQIDRILPILYMHSYWPYLVCNIVMALDWCQNLLVLNIFSFPAKYLLNLNLALFLHEKRCSGLKSDSLSILVILMFILIFMNM